jgi:TPP-dependent pyruvate/acetoin dehydrogenase alpha subunit
MPAPTVEYKVERRPGEPGRCVIELVKYEVERGLILSRRRRAGVLARLRADDYDLAKISRHKGELGEAADYARRGEFGTCVDVQTARDGSVQVRLVSRHFTGDDFVTEVTADECFDAGDPDALVAASEFAAELKVWAEERNEDLVEETASVLSADDEATATRIARQRAADELSAIVRRAGR